jgi:hypothetical protein
MNGENSGVPFGTPPVGFMQTGNQAFENVGAEANGFGGTTAPVSTAGPEDFSGGNVAMPDPFSPPPSEFVQPAIQEKQKYAIVDLFWLINPKFYMNPKQQPLQTEAHFVILSFNIDFGNMRVAFLNLTKNAIQNNIVYLENLKRLVAGTIYPATAFNAYTSPRLATTCLEQLFKQIPGANWQQERPVCTIEKNEEKIRFTVKDPRNGTYFYDFISWQREAFLYACNFAYTKGFELTAQQHMK